MESSQIRCCSCWLRQPDTGTISRCPPAFWILGDRITYLVSELMRDRTKFIGTPTELSEKIDPVGMERISPKKVSRLILQNLDALSKIGISGMVRRSNGKRLIELRRAESDDAQGVPVVAPVDPVGALCGDLREIAGHGE